MIPNPTVTIVTYIIDYMYLLHSHIAIQRKGTMILSIF